jgi:hypothetical protein
MLVLLYTLTGFLGMPVLIESLIVNTLREDFGRAASVERVHFNPYVLGLEVQGFAVRDTDGAELAGFDHLLVNFQLSSLFRWAWTFREIRCDGLEVDLERFAPGDSRLSRLLADHAARTATGETEAETGSGLPRLLIQELSLGEGRVRFRDRVPADPVEFEFGPIDVEIDNLNTLPDHEGQQAVQVRLPEGAALSWQGSLDLGPFRSKGRFSISNSSLDRTIGYLQAFLPLQSMRAVLSLESDYHVREREDGSLEFDLEALQAEFSDVAVTGLQPATEFITLGSLQFSGGTLSYPENTLHFAGIHIEEPNVLGWLDEAGEPSLLQLTESASGDPSPAAPEPSDDVNWRIGVDEFTVTGGRIGFTDRSISPQAELGVEAIDLAVRAVSNDQNARFPVDLSANLASGGQIGFQGGITVLPELTADGTLNVGDVRLSVVQPYLQQQLSVLIREGSLASALEVELSPDGEITAAGDLTVDGLEVDDTLEEEPLLNWNRLAIDRLQLATGPRRLELSTVDFQQPFGRLVIREDLTTNVSGLIIEDGASAEPPSPDEANALPFAIVVGGIRVQDGSMDFADFSLPLPFATRIRQLEGTVSTIDTTSAAPANIRLEGKVDDYGLARIDGAMDLLDPIRRTDVTMEFRNLLMSNLSPYTVDFAGREIDEGKLDLDLRYRIVDGQLQGQNAAVMSDLVLGKEVDSPNAVSLPLDLAVALLTDADGVIDIDLPVEGDINDPEFRIGGVIWKAFAGLVTKIVTAPFRLLGSLIGIDTEDLGQFEFLAGRADLTPPEMEKVVQLQQALQQRPELSVEIPPVFDPRIDIPALQFEQLKGAVIERLGSGDGDPEGEFRMLNDRVRGILEDLFVERHPEVTLESVKQAYLAPPAGDPDGKPVLDELAYAAELRDRLLASETIGQDELAALASARADSVRQAFLASGEFDTARVVLAEPVQTESEDDEWVVMELGVASN